MNLFHTEEPPAPEAEHSLARLGALVFLVGIPALALTAAALITNRDKVRLAADRTADSIKRAGKSFSRAAEPGAVQIDRAVQRVSDAVREALSEVRSAVR